MKHTIRIHRNGETDIATATAEQGASLLDFLRRQGVALDTPCGGQGTCGKCAVRVAGCREAPTESEAALLGADKLRGGYRLACNMRIEADMDVYPDEAASGASIITRTKKRNVMLEPIVTKEYVELPVPALDNQLPDLERLLAAAPERFTAWNTALLSELPGILRSSGFKVTLVGAGGRLIAAEAGDTTRVCFGTAVDIGTTTVAAYLYDLNTGKCLAVGSMLNPQRMYGADVITRVSHTARSDEHRRQMQSLISDCINELFGQLVQRAGIDTNDIYAAVFAGNTTMLHFLMGLDATSMAVSPFIPVTTSLQVFNPEKLGIAIHKRGKAVLFPGVSAYIGADTVAAILSCGMFESEEVSLLVDVGTNGEIVLGCSEWMLACSTAAGPAFEGADIRCGVGGISGAIDSVGEAPLFRCTTIGNAAPVGICGSGLIDAAARLLDAGLIDETGRLADEAEARELEPALADRMITVDGIRAFRLAGENTAECIVITQKDIRGLQNAKAAIAAGIDTLITHAGRSCGDIRKVYLAGGFGSSINIESAVRIGLLPAPLKDRIEAVGNASGEGASEGLLSAKLLRLSEQIGRSVRYIELSSSAEFAEKYVNNMLF